MQTLLLACYICLQLTTSPDVKSACDQCVTGLFEQAGISSNLQEALASNSALKQALEEKLKAVLPQEPVTTPDEAGQGSFLEKPAESNQISQEQAQRDALIKAREEAVEKEIQEKTDEIAAKVKRYEVQLNDELAALIRTKSEDISYKVKKFKDNLDVDFTLFAQIKRDTLAMDIAEMKQQVAVTGHGDTLENCHALVARDSLVSENGQYKATMLKSGELIITTGNDIVIKRFGNKSTESTDCILLIQPDCNLVIYNSGRATWATGNYDPTYGTRCYLKINNYGDLSVYNQGQRVWTA